MAKKVNVMAALEVNNASLLNKTSQSLAIQTDQIYWLPREKVHPHPAEENIYDTSEFCIPNETSADDSMGSDVDDGEHKDRYAELRALAEDIARRGIQTPLKVYARDDGEYVLIGGHRRRAANELAIKLYPEYREKGSKLPCIIKPAYDPNKQYEAIEDMILDNLQREKSDYDKVRETAMYHECLSQRKQSGEDIKIRQTIIKHLGRSDSEITRHLLIMKDLIPGLLEYFKQDLIAQTVAYEIAKKEVPFQRFLLDDSTWDKHTKLSLRDVRIIEDKYQDALREDNTEDASVEPLNAANDDDSTISEASDYDVEAAAGDDITDIPEQPPVSVKEHPRKVPIRDIGSGLTMMNTSLSRINTVLSEDNLSNLKTREKDKILRKIEKQTASLAALLDELEELGLDKKEVMRKHGV